MATFDVAVLGAGVIGLSTAVLLQQTRQDCRVTIIADQFSPDTTSDAAGALWEPYAVGNTDPAFIKDTGLSTYKYLKQLAFSSDAAIAGVNYTTVFQYDDSTMEDHPIKEYISDYRRLTPEELQEHPGYRMGLTFTSPTVDVSLYLQWLMQRFKSKGGRVQKRKIHSLTELVGQYDVLVNCCGLGNSQLTGDPEVYPVKGQILQVEAPWIKNCYLFIPTEGEPATYLITRGRTVVIGGTCDKDWSTHVDADTEKKLWENAVRCMPMLTHAKILKSWAGLRPCRNKIRLEPEVIAHGLQPLRVVHNYGHGGAGVTLHWGCAEKAVAFVSEFLPPRPATTTATTKSLRLKHKL